MDKYLQKVDACNRASIFTYDTGNSTLSTYDFAEDLDSFVAATIRSNNFQKGDKISLIMHSQGGIVGSLWLLKLKTDKSPLFNQIDSFITLSTPYWGSMMADLGGKFFYTLPEGIDNPISPMGRIELQEMSYASSTIRALHWRFKEIFGHKKIRPLALGGLKMNFNPYIGEDDNTVPVYSSRPDHYYIHQKINLGEGIETVTSEKFDKSNLVPFIPVSATHFKFELPGIAQIPESCIEDINCTHPSIPHILRHLRGEKPLFNDYFQFRTYRVNVYLDGWKEIIKDEEEIEMIYTNSLGINQALMFEIKKGDVLSATISGTLSHYSEQELNLELRIKGKKAGVIKAPVKGGHSTFVSLTLTNS